MLLLFSLNLTQITKSAGAQAVVEETDTKTRTAVAVVKETDTKSRTANAYVSDLASKNVGAKAEIALAQQLPASAIIFGTLAGPTRGANAYLVFGQLARMQTPPSGYAFLWGQMSPFRTASAYIAPTPIKTAGGYAVIPGPLFASGVAKIVAKQTPSTSGSADIKVTTSKNSGAQANVVETDTKHPGAQAVVALLASGRSPGAQATTRGVQTGKSTGAAQVVLVGAPGTGIQYIVVDPSFTGYADSVKSSTTLWNGSIPANTTETITL